MPARARIVYRSTDRTLAAVAVTGDSEHVELRINLRRLTEPEREQAVRMVSAYVRAMRSWNRHERGAAVRMTSPRPLRLLLETSPARLRAERRVNAVGGLVGFACALSSTFGLAPKAQPSAPA